MPTNPQPLAEPRSIRRLERIGARLAIGGVATAAATIVVGATLLDPVEPTTIFSVRAVVILLAGAATLTGLWCLAYAGIAARRGRTQHGGWAKIAGGVALTGFVGMTALGTLGGLGHSPNTYEPTAPVAGAYTLQCDTAAFTGTPEKTLTGASALDAIELVQATGATAAPESALGILHAAEFPPAGLPDASAVTMVGKDRTTGADVAAVTIMQPQPGPWTVARYEVCPR